MTSERDGLPAHCWIATLEAGEQTARRLADAFGEAFAAGDAAVSLDVAGHVAASHVSASPVSASHVAANPGRWRVTVYFHAAPDEHRVRELAALAGGAEAAQALCFARVAQTDWVAESLAGLKPVQAGRFVVHGAHDRARIPSNRISIEIEAALAFGTGHHGTTRGCLLALDLFCKARSQRRKLRILDLGTGSGVLAIAGARTLRSRVLATDVDAQAVRVAHANARLNHVGSLIEAVRADGVARRVVQARAPFDLVFANILLGPLQRFAAPLSKIAAPGARVILSGLLSSQANAAIAAYRPLALERRIDLDGWTTLVFARR